MASPTAKNYVPPSINSTQVEKPCSRGTKGKKKKKKSLVEARAEAIRKENVLARTSGRSWATSEVLDRRETVWERDEGKETELGIWLCLLFHWIPLQSTLNQVLVGSAPLLQLKAVCAS